MRRAPTLLCGLLSLWVLGIAAPSAAQTSLPDRPSPAVRLELREAADGLLCPGEEHLRQEVLVRTHYDPFDRTARRTISVVIDRAGAQLVGRILYLDGARRLDERSFTVPDLPCTCWSLFTYLAVAIAFTLTPFQPPPETSLTPTPCPVCPPGSPCPTPALDPSAPFSPGEAQASPSRPDRHDIQAGLGGVFLIGSTTAVAGALLAQIEPRWGGFSLPIEGRFQLPTPGEGVLGTPFDVTVYSAALAPCFHRGRFFLCSVGELGAFRLRAREQAEGESLRAALFVGARGGLEVPLVDPLFLQLRAEVMGTVTPRTIELGDDRWPSSPLTLRLGGTFMMRF